MVGDHHTSERVHARLKADLLAGHDDAARLNINALAQRYDTSATPVREALLRLVGEGLVEMPDTGGFVLPRVDLARAREYYEFSLALALFVTNRLPSQPPSLPIDLTGSQLRLPIDALLRVLARRAGNDVMTIALESLNDRMHPIRRMEEMRLHAIDREFAELLSSVEANSTAEIRKILKKYHHRRQRLISKILGLSA